MRTSWDEFYLGLAKYMSTRSKDPSTKVGAVIVRHDRSVCSVGYNGFPQDMPDDEELYNNRDEKYSRIIHAEINALTFAREEVSGYTLFTYPFMPCDRCFVQLAQNQIWRMVAPKPTADQLTRWGTAFDKVRQYAKEMSILLEEIDYV
jgi:dCMP deaminase